MNMHRVAVLGGDAREAYIAQRLLADGFEVAVYGGSVDGRSAVEHAPSAEAAVRGAQWIVCPSPGLGDGDRVYAPGSALPIVLDAALLAASDASEGGLVLGRATPGVLAAAAAAGVDVFEMKDDPSLPGSNGISVAEALVALLVGKTVRILREHKILVLGYGATGAALTDALLGLSCRVWVAARRPEVLARAEERGAIPVDYAGRVAAMAEASIVVNTVPSRDAISEDAFAALGETIVVDIASPPGGTDHEAARRAGVDVTWARGLAGSRAPHSAGDSQLRFIVQSMSHAAPDGQSPAGVPVLSSAEEAGEVPA